MPKLCCRVDIINVIKIGIRLFENPTRFSIEVLTMTIISEKFFIIIVTIKIYVI